MNSTAWAHIESLYDHPLVSPTTVAAFRKLKLSQSTHTKGEGNPHHYCSFFLPYDTERAQIYLGHHKKADDWIPPGGHIEPGESPLDAVIREMQEELQVKISSAQIEPWNLSVKKINRPQSGCMAHYDIWHLIHIPMQSFDYDKGEYYDAGWFSIPEGIAKITKNPDFASILAKL